MNENVAFRFPEALKKQLTRGFFSFPELLVGLSREEAFRGFPPLQYMMQALPASGFLRPLLMAESLVEVERMVGDFVSLTGFRNDCAGYLFSSFAYAIGLLGDPPGMPVVECDGNVGDTSGNCMEEPGAVYGGAIPAWDSRWSMEEKCRFLSRLVTVNRENERRLGMRAGTAACVAVDRFSFRLTVELSRLEPGATGALYYAVYDREGKIADVAALGVMCYDDVSPLPKVATVLVAPQEVARILIYWEND